jgi:hypothetical protein
MTGCTRRSLKPSNRSESANSWQPGSNRCMTPLRLALPGRMLLKPCLGWFQHCLSWLRVVEAVIVRPRALEIEVVNVSCT